MSNLCAFCGKSLGSVLHTGNIRWVRKFGVSGNVMACRACAALALASVDMPMAPVRVHGLSGDINRHWACCPHCATVVWLRVPDPLGAATGRCRSCGQLVSGQHAPLPDNGTADGDSRMQVDSRGKVQWVVRKLTPGVSRVLTRSEKAAGKKLPERSEERRPEEKPNPLYDTASIDPTGSGVKECQAALKAATNTLPKGGRVVLRRWHERENILEWERLEACYTNTMIGKERHKKAREVQKGKEAGRD